MSEKEIPAVLLLTMVSDHRFPGQEDGCAEGTRTTFGILAEDAARALEKDRKGAGFARGFREWAETGKEPDMKGAEILAGRWEKAFRRSYALERPGYFERLEPNVFSAEDEYDFGPEMKPLGLAETGIYYTLAGGAEEYPDSDAPDEAFYGFRDCARRALEEIAGGRVMLLCCVNNQQDGSPWEWMEQLAGPALALSSKMRMEEWAPEAPARKSAKL